jgi:hypothetical protein
MPFKPEFTFPTALPLVKVFFNGLMIVKPNADGSECEAFVHKTALAHELSIEIRLKQPNRPDQTVMRHLGPLELLAQTQSGKKHGFILTTNPIPNIPPSGVRAYRGAATTTVDPIERVVDVNLLHTGKTHVLREVGEPNIFMNDALFYCAEKTVPGLEIELRNTEADTTVIPLGQISSILGANIYATSVNVAWREKGEVQGFPLTNDIPTAAYYEVYINNDPPYVPLPPAGGQPHDELGEYYKLLPRVPRNEQLKLYFKKIPGQIPGTPVPAQDKGSNRLPCMTVIDSGA